MTQPAKSQEPSMEEILASIRRIIADEDSTKVPPRGAEASKLATPVRPGPRLSAPASLSSPAAAPVAEQSPGKIPEVGHPRAVGGEGGAAAAGTEAADILDLTEAMAAVPPAPEPNPPPAFRTIDGQSDVFFNEEPARPAGTPEPPRPAASHYGERELLSARTSAAVDAAFNALTHTVLEQNARTLEDLVKEMLRPMLKSWLDDNLPTLVERLVRAEIERVSRGR